MRERSNGLKALAIGSVVVALYCQLAAMALIFNAAFLADSGSVNGVLGLALGPVFLALSLAAYALAYGFWAIKHWSLTLGTAVFVALIGASLALAVISTNVTSVLMPALGAVLGIWYLHRPAIRAELVGEDAASVATSAGQQRVEVSGQTR